MTEANAANYTVAAIPLPPGSASATIAGINDAGQVAGTARDSAGNILSNFLYTPGIGVTNVESTGTPIAAINGSGQILLQSGLLYTAGRPTQNLAPAIAAAFPTETAISFLGLNDNGTVSGISQRGDNSGVNFSEHIFRYSPGSPEGVVSVASTNNPRTFPAGPFLINDAGDVVYTTGFIPFGARIFNAAQATTETGCGSGNGQAYAINNSGQIGGGWGRMTEFPEICTFDPVRAAWTTAALTGETGNIADAGFVAALNDQGDAVGRRGGFPPSGTPTLFTQGQSIDVNTLFPPGSGWVAISASRINNAGEIAGVGALNGVPAAYVLSPLLPATYSLRKMCANSCFGTALSNSGWVAWGSSAGVFHVTSPRNGVFDVPLPVANIQQINSRGDVVGQDELGHAIAAAAPYPQLDNLNSVFGWFPGMAQSINDGGDVVGFGSGGIPGSIFGFLGLNVTSFTHINNARQITGTYADPGGRIHNFLFTPGAGIIDLPGQPFALSNTGHVLLLSGGNGQYALWRPEGSVALPAGFQWKALNDRDELAGDDLTQVGAQSAVFYSAGRGLVRLAPLLLNSGFSVSSVNGLNNAGQILVYAISHDFLSQVAVLLTPVPGSF